MNYLRFIFESYYLLENQQFLLTFDRNQLRKYFEHLRSTQR